MLRGSWCGSTLFAPAVGGTFPAGGGWTRPGPLSQISTAEPAGAPRACGIDPANTSTASSTTGAHIRFTTSKATSD